MFELIQEMFSYTFIIRAVIVGVLVSLCASLLGVSLVLKKYSMIGDGLSHVGFGALAVSTALGLSPLKFTIPIVIIVAFLLLKINDSSKIKGDSLIALISASSLAIGVMSISVTSGINTDIFNYLFGSILAMSSNDVILSVILSSIVLTLFIVFYHKIFAVTFDENFSRATGIKTNIYNMLIAILTAVTVVIGMRLMGSLLISSLIIFPALTSMRVFKTFKSVMISSAIISIVCFLIGITLSYIYAFPTGASIVLINLILLIIFMVVNKLIIKVTKIKTTS